MASNIMLIVFLNCLPCILTAVLICPTKETHLEYDTSTHLCCNKTLHERQRQDEMCCGDQIYAGQTHLCCGGKVVSRYVGNATKCLRPGKNCQKQMCCESRAVAIKNNKCCGGVLYSFNKAQAAESMHCCGSSLIDIRTMACCNISTYPLSSTKDCCKDSLIYDRHHEHCLKSNPPQVVDNSIEFCGGAKYNMSEKICCNDVLCDFPEAESKNAAPLYQNSMCCGSLAYDSTKSKCCLHGNTRAHLIPLHPELSCCGNGFFNVSHQDCNRGFIVAKVPGAQTCGSNYIDPTSQGCCGDVFPYNKSSHDCCIGEKFSIIPKNKTCCNGEVIDDDQLCCDHIPTKKLRPSDDSCCINLMNNQVATFNRLQNQFCVQGEVMSVPSGAEPCGRHNYYYPETHICCGETAWDLSRGFDQCCLDKPFSSKSQQCCNLDIVNLAATNGSCCLKDYKVYKFGDLTNPCLKSCGKATSDIITERCCQEVKHPFNHQTQCCGTRTINTSTTSCCGGHIPYSKDQRCCGNKDIFNPKSSFCFKDKIIPKNKLLRKQKPTQHLCHKQALKHFDGPVRVGCTSRFAVVGHLSKVHVNSTCDSHLTHIDFELTKIRNLQRGNNFTSLLVLPKTLRFTILVSKGEDVLCRDRYLSRFCTVMVFFNQKVHNGHVKVTETSPFVMTRYYRNRESLMTRHISFEFCKNNFNV